MITHEEVQQVETSYRNGVLSLRFPKRERSPCVDLHDRGVVDDDGHVLASWWADHVSRKRILRSGPHIAGAADLGPSRDRLGDDGRSCVSDTPSCRRSFCFSSRRRR
jgi:hypothetical protein